MCYLCLNLHTAYHHSCEYFVIFKLNFLYLITIFLDDSSLRCRLCKNFFDSLFVFCEFWFWIFFERIFSLFFRVFFKFFRFSRIRFFRSFRSFRRFWSFFSVLRLFLSISSIFGLFDFKGRFFRIFFLSSWISFWRFLFFLWP